MHDMVDCSKAKSFFHFDIKLRSCEAHTYIVHRIFYPEKLCAKLF